MSGNYFNMRKVYLILSAVAFLATSCSVDLGEVGSEDCTYDSLPELTAGFESVSKTYVEDSKYLRWHENDRLTVFFANTLNRQYTFNGSTGDNNGTFSYVPDGILGTGNSIANIVAVYPYNSSIGISDVTGRLSLTLPQNQTYAENSFGKGAGVMVAKTAGPEDTYLSFKNVCGYLVLKLYGAGTKVKSIALKGNASEKIAGPATLAMEYAGVPELSMASDATDEIVLNCGDGVSLSSESENPTQFWIAVPPTTFKNGISIVVTGLTGKTYEMSTQNEVVIGRNEVQPMAALEVQIPELGFVEGSSVQMDFSCEYNSFNPEIISNVQYEVIIPDEAKSWLSYNPKYSNPFTISTNNTTSPRTAVITFKQVGGDLSASIIVNQDCFKGFDDSMVDPSKYLTYSANTQSTGYGDAFDYNSYTYCTAFSSSAYNVVVAEYKFKLSDISSVQSFEYPLSNNTIRITKSGIQFYEYDDGGYCLDSSYSWSSFNVSAGDLLTIRIDEMAGMITVNGKSISAVPYSAMAGYVYSSYYYDRDDGVLLRYRGIREDTRLYYAKGWDKHGRLCYLGYPIVALNPNTGKNEACWYAQGFTNELWESKTFAYYKSSDYKPLGMGNL